MGKAFKPVENLIRKVNHIRGRGRERDHLKKKDGEKESNCPNDHETNTRHSSRGCDDSVVGEWSQVYWPVKYERTTASFYRLGRRAGSMMWVLTFNKTFLYTFKGKEPEGGGE